MITKEEKKLVNEFFNGNEILAECFFQLYEYQSLTVNDIQLEFREGLIGFKREGERLRLYVIKDKNGVFRIKIKAATSHIFMPAEMINYQSDLDKNNLFFDKNESLIKTKQKVGNIKNEPKKADNSDKKETVIKRSTKNNGVQEIKIQNLSVDDIQPILDSLKEFKRDGIKNVKVKITETE